MIVRRYVGKILNGVYSSEDTHQIVENYSYDQNSSYPSLWWSQRQHSFSYIHTGRLLTEKVNPVCQLMAVVLFENEIEISGLV